MSSENRRKYLRIDDEVSLYVHPLTDTESEKMIAHFETRRLDFSLMTHLIYGRDQHMPQMRIIQKRHPDIAAYLKFLESQIETLSSRLVDKDHRLDPDVKVAVNISADGIQFDTNMEYPADSAFEIAVMVFPTRVSLLAFGSVVRSEKNVSEDGEVWKTAIRFTHIHEEDREVLIKHIHQKQLEDLRQRESSVYSEEEAG